MFSRTDNGRVISLPDEDVADFLNEMADAANYALRDMATVMPILKSVEIPQEETAGSWVRYDLKVFAPDFMRLVPNRVTWTDGDEFEQGCEYRTDGPQGILLRGRGRGAYTVWYEAYPEEVTAETPDDAVFSLAPEALDLVPVYMASRIYGEEDISLAVHYLNQYQARRGELMARAAGLQTDGGGWRGDTGWW